VLLLLLLLLVAELRWFMTCRLLLLLLLLLLGRSQHGCQEVNILFVVLLDAAWTAVLTAAAAAAV
jgi:hypothetical protein